MLINPNGAHVRKVDVDEARLDHDVRDAGDALVRVRKRVRLRLRLRVRLRAGVTVLLRVLVLVRVRARVTGSLTWRRISSAIEKPFPS